jgi:predicted amidohydrolase YtcJ
MSPAIFHVADALESHPPLLWRFDDLHAAGAICTVGTDWPMPDSPSLFPTLTALVGKLKVDPVAVRAGQQAKTEDKTPQQLSGEIICRMITLGAAEALGTDDKTGSIAVGKKANFIMVDRDLSRGEFDGASVLKTWFMGDMVWDADGPFRTSV